MTPELLDLIEMLHICDDPKRLEKLENFYYDPVYNEAVKEAEKEDLAVSAEKVEYTEEDKEKAKQLLAEIREERYKPVEENEVVFDSIKPEEIPNDFEDWK